MDFRDDDERALILSFLISCALGILLYGFLSIQSEYSALELKYGHLFKKTESQQLQK